MTPLYKQGKDYALKKLGLAGATIPAVALGTTPALAGVLATAAQGDRYRANKPADILRRLLAVGGGGVLGALAGKGLGRALTKDVVHQGFTAPALGSLVGSLTGLGAAEYINTQNYRKEHPVRTHIEDLLT